MSTVFIGGSRRLSRVNAELARRLDNIVNRQLRVLVGDANGFDRATQANLAARRYSLVVVYCTAGECRNNIGEWPVRSIEYSGRDRGREFYTAKDDAMLRDACYGLFAWDGKSKGTLRNIAKMAELGKPCVVFVSPENKYVTVRSSADMSGLVGSDVAAPAVSQDLFADLPGGGNGLSVPNAAVVAPG